MIRYPVAPFDTQPQEAVEIDRGNPLTAGLVGYVNAGSLPAPSSGAVHVSDPTGALVIGPSGRAHQADNASRLYVRADRPLTNAITLLYVGNLRAVGATGGGFPVAVGNVAGTDVLFGFQQGATTVTPRAVVRTSNGGAISSAHFTGFNANNADLTDVAVIVGVYDGTSAIATYLNGEETTITALTGASGSMAAATVVGLGLQRGSPTPAVPGVNGPQVVYLGAVWDRVLSAEEIREVSRNPWQLFRVSHVEYRPSAGAAYSLAADVGAFALSGQSATLRATRTVPADVGAFALAGQAATLRTTRTLSSAVGAFTLAGQAATLTKTGSYALTADVGSFALAGQAATLRRAAQLTADASAFALSGQDAALRVARTLGGDVGAFVLAGQSAGLIYSAEAGWSGLLCPDITLSPRYTPAVGLTAALTPGVTLAPRYTPVVTLKSRCT